MSILIIGSEGSQGKRYQAILSHLGKDFIRVDASLPGSALNPSLEENIEGIIIATPTESHVSVIKSYLRLKKPMLVEKPICKKIDDLSEVLELSKASDIKLSMMFQYKKLGPSDARQKSYYDYFRHGDDGLIWDCFQIIALSKAEVFLKESSPIWNCTINGRKLNSGDMDKAYIDEVKEWLSGKEKETAKEIMDAHQKVATFEKICGTWGNCDENQYWRADENSHRNTSQKQKPEATEQRPSPH